MIHFLAAGAMVLAQSNSAATCVTRQEISVMAVAMLPDLITRAATRCTPHIGADSYLVRDGATLAGRLRQDGAGQTGAARAAFEKVAGRALPAGVSDDTAVAMMAQAMSTEFTQGLSADACRNVNGMFEAMAPLPAANIGNLVASLFALANAGGRGRWPELCRS